MNDREKLIDWISDVIDFVDWDHIEEIVDQLIAKGVVVQEQGEWILTDGWRCSRCLSLCPFTCDEQEDLSNYCPNCGAKMKEVK